VNATWLVVGDPSDPDDCGPSRLLERQRSRRAAIGHPCFTECFGGVGRQVNPRVARLLPQREGRPRETGVSKVANCDADVQDDSGIPLGYFGARRWRFLGKRRARSVAGLADFSRSAGRSDPYKLLECFEHDERALAVCDQFGIIFVTDCPLLNLPHSSNVWRIIFHITVSNPNRVLPVPPATRASGPIGHDVGVE
jgi:hypothetical protein